MTETQDPDQATYDYLALDMEWRLTIAYRLSHDGCGCPRYFASRRDALFSAILKKAAEEGGEVDEIFHDFQKKVHARNCEPS